MTFIGSTFRGKVGAYSRFTTDWGEVTEECDVAKCVHCQRQIFVPSRANPNDLMGWCNSCDGALCIRCQRAADAGKAFIPGLGLVPTNRCVPWIEAFEREMAARQMLADMGF